MSGCLTIGSCTQLLSWGYICVARLRAREDTWMARRQPLPTSLGTNFTVAGALREGVAEKRLESDDLSAPFWGARTRHVAEVAPPGERVADRVEREHRDFVARCASYVSVGPEGFRFSHVTAARLFRMPLPSRLMRSQLLHVAVARGKQPPRRVGVVGHRVPTPLGDRTVTGLAVLEPERVWFQLAPLLTVDELVIAGDHLVRRKRAASTLTLLTSALAGAGGFRRVHIARTALRDIRPGTDSPKESEVRLSIVRAGLPEPVVGYKVHDDDGFFIGTPDLAYVREKIAIEYQGKHHQDDDRTYEDDIIRRQLFTAAGWHIILVTKAHSAQYSVSRVREALAQRPVDSLGHGTPSRR